MDKFWVVVRTDDGAAIHESYEPVWATSKEEVLQALMNHEASVAEKKEEKYAAFAAWKKAGDNSSDAADAYVKAARSVPVAATINGVVVCNILGTDDHMVDDYEILSDDEFFDHMARPAPTVEGEHYVKISVHPIVSIEDMDMDDLDEDGSLLISNSYLIVLKSVPDDFAEQNIIDAALDEFHDKVAIAMLENFYINAEAVPAPRVSEYREFANVFDVTYQEVPLAAAP
jgi:hypothetical protein